MIMVDYRTLKINDEVTFVTDEPFSKPVKAIVTEVHEDYAIAATDDNMTLWIDEDTEYLFTR